MALVLNFFPTLGCAQIISGGGSLREQDSSSSRPGALKGQKKRPQRRTERPEKEAPEAAD